MLRHKRPELRYAVAFGALIAISVCPFTLAYVYFGQQVNSYAHTGGWLGSVYAWHQLLTPWLLTAWLLIVGLHSLRILDACGRTLRMMRAGCWEADEDVLAVVRDVVARARLKRDTDVRESIVVHVPAVYGWRRPVMVIPAWIMREMTPAQLETIVAHELAHVARNDWIINVFQVHLEAIMFFHPAVWFLGNRIRQEREYCCDDAAVRLYGNRVHYAEALLQMEETRVARPAASLSIAGGDLHARIKRLLYPAPPTHRKHLVDAATYFLVATVLAITPILF
jgi:beta-lactamase regulating signal transducer with metallopeptidase domain